MLAYVCKRAEHWRATAVCARCRGCLCAVRAPGSACCHSPLLFASAATRGEHLEDSIRMVTSHMHTEAWAAHAQRTAPPHTVVCRPSLTQGSSPAELFKSALGRSCSQTNCRSCSRGAAKDQAPLQPPEGPYPRQQRSVRQPRGPCSAGAGVPATSETVLSPSATLEHLVPRSIGRT